MDVFKETCVKCGAPTYYGYKELTGKKDANGEDETRDINLCPFCLSKVLVDAITGQLCSIHHIDKDELYGMNVIDSQYIGAYKGFSVYGCNLPHDVIIKRIPHECFHGIMPDRTKATFIFSLEENDTGNVTYDIFVSETYADFFINIERCFVEHLKSAEEK